MKKFVMILAVIISTAATLAGCGSGGGGIALAPSGPTAATTKMYLFGTMSSATAGGSAGIMDSITTTISALPAGVTLTSITPSGAAATITSGMATYGFDVVTRDLAISLLNGDHIAVVADTISNAGQGVEVATLTFSLPRGVTPPIPSPGGGTIVFQYRDGPLSVKELSGCVVNFTTTYH